MGVDEIERFTAERVMSNDGGKKVTVLTESG